MANNQKRSGLARFGRIAAEMFDPQRVLKAVDSRKRRNAPAPEQVYVAPRTAIEEILAAIWSENLGVEQVGINDNFFELGGHSMLATQVVSRVRDALKVDVTLKTLFERPTVARLAEAVEAARRAGRQPAPPVVQVSRTGELPLSFAQQRLWFIQQLEPENPAYNIPLVVRLRGIPAEAALGQSLGEIVRRHEVLRTRFVTQHGRPAQVIDPAVGALAVPLIDLSHLGRDREPQARQFLQREARRPFDLELGPVWRAALLRLSEGEHLLIVCIHHVASDGWSMGVIVKEFTALYDAFGSGRASGLAELEVQYADFALWQREWFSGEVLQRQLDYWRQQLEGVPLLELPTDQPRSAQARGGGGSYRFTLDEELTQGLRQAARDEGLTLFMVLLAAFHALLWRYSGQDDLTVGTPISGRNRVETEELIGFFVNTLVLRARLQARMRVRELLQQVREVALGAYEHQEVPFERLVEELQPERSLSHEPLFQVMLVLQNMPRAAASPRRLEIAAEPPAVSTAKFDLIVTVSESGGQLQVAVEYARPLYSRSRIQRLAGHWRQLLVALTGEGERRLSEVELLTAAERQQVVVEWNATAGAASAASAEGWSGGVVAMVAEQVRRRPEAVAVIYEQQQVSYGELWRRVGRLSRHLRRLGVGPESRVGLEVERGVAMAVAVLGVLRSGGAYVPLDPAYPQERLSYMVADAAVAVVVRQVSQGEPLSGEGVAVVVLGPGGLPQDERRSETRASDADEEAGADEDIWPLAESLAYIIYTSGSTGRPKGVSLPHRALANLIDWHRQRLLSGVKLLQFASLSFDASFHELFAAWASGGTVVIIGEELRRDAATLMAYIGQQNIEKVILPVVVLQQMAGLREQRAGLRMVRELTTTGEQLQVSPAVIELFEQLPNCRLHNHYGPSETHVVTAYELAAEPRQWVRQPAIGRPIWQAEAYVLGGGGEVLGSGVSGELYLGGEALARGYWRRPELTAERFVPDEVSGGGGRRLYRSGDRCRATGDGELYYEGRLDQQVKVRGYRIELGEIEAVLSHHSAVEQCVVIARQDQPGDNRLVAYIVASGPEVPKERELRQYSGRKLPDYMVPSAYVWLEQMPLTSNGKLDRKRLPEPSNSGGGAEGRAAKTPVEQIVAQIWSEVLRREHVGADENFFELGGHSLLATQVVSRLREALGVELPVRVMFEAPTVAGLAEVIEAERGAGRRVEEPPIVRVGRDRELPLSYAQQRLWFIQQFEPDSSAYNMPIVLRLRGALSLGALRQSLAEIARRHEVLRTRFEIREGLPMQVIDDPAQIELPMIDLSGLWQAQGQQQARRVVTEEAGRPFELEQGPMFRTGLARLGAEDHLLMVCIHHVASDGWSMGVIVKEFTAAYEAYGRGQPSPLEELEVQYADFAVWQREWLSGEVLDEQMSYWRRQLAGVQILELPTDRGRAGEASQRGASLAFSLSAEITQGLKGFARREGVTLFMALLAGYEAVLARYTGQSDIAVGTPISGRNRVETEGLIGFFVNTLVMRSEVRGDESLRELVRRVRETALGAYVHQDLPFEKLVEELQPERDLRRAPLFQVMLVLQNLPRETATPSGLRVAPEPAAVTTAKFDLTLSLTEVGEELHGAIEYATDLYDRSRVMRMVGHLQLLLEAMQEEAGRRLADIPLLTPPQRQQLLVEWNATQADHQAGKCLPELFERQARLRPDTVAVIFDEHQLSYRELKRKADLLAAHLRRVGVGPDSRVALHVERSLEMVIGLLGVLKAGGAYVPLDPSYPSERLAFMLEDAEVGVVVTQPHLAGSLPARQARLLALTPRGVPEVQPPYCEHADYEDADYEAGEQRFLDSGLSGENLAYVIYTSGSTGRPKGVGLTHRALMNLIEWHSEAMVVGVKVLQFASLSFDASFHEMFAAWATGGSVVLISEQMRFDVAALMSHIGERNIEKLILPVVVLQQMAGRDGRRRELKGVKEITTTGEQLQISRAIVDLFEELGGCRLHNHYGPSESHVVTYYELGDEASAWDDHPPIGKAIANSRIYILDERQGAVPVGVKGELYIGGECLARGYIGRGDMTAERFIPDGISGREGERLYRTGDVCWYRADANIEYLGRKDEQVKIRGFRIEPGEIESALMKHESIRDAIVILQEEAGEKRLAAYVTVDSRRAPVIAGHPRHPLPNQMAIAYLNKNEADAIYEEIFEEKAHTQFGIAIYEGDCIFDVGANIGLFSLFAISQSSKVRIHAFEPNPKACEVLRINAALYGQDVKVYEYGLSNKETSAEFTFYPRASVWSGFYAMPEEDEGYFRAAVENQAVSEALEHMNELMEGRFDKEVFSCKLRRLSDVIREEKIERIDLLKVDVERAEQDVIDGIEEEDWEKIEQVVVEVHDIENRKEAMVALLEEKGFEVKTDQERLLVGTDMYHIYGRKPSRVSKEHALQEKDSGGKQKAVYEPLLSVSELRSHLKNSLPDYMIPSAFVMLDEFPLTPNGKIDKKALPRPDQIGLNLKTKYVRARTTTEEILTGIWSSVLGVEKLGVEDNFFELGGHSLLATQVIYRARGLLGVEIPVRALFENPTVAELAAVIERERGSGRTAAAPAVAAVSRTGELPLSFAQQRLWFIQQLEPENATYNMPVALRMHGALNTLCLQQSLSEIVRRHEVLRTTFQTSEYSPAQLIGKPSAITLPVCDLSHLYTSDIAQQSRRMMVLQSRRRFDLERGPVWRAALLRLSEQEHVLVVCIHHVASDGWSMGVIVKEFTALYDAFGSCRPSGLAELEVQYADFALWQRQWLTGEVLDRQLAYWREQLLNLPVLELPTDHPRPAVASHRGHSLSFRLQQPLSADLNALSRRQGVTLFMTLLAGFQALLWRYSGQADLAVGTPISGRNRAETEELIGFFVNTLVLRADFRGRPKVGELLRQVREVALAAYEHQEVPFERLVEELQPERSLSHEPLFQVMFIYQNLPQAAAEVGGLRVSQEGVRSGWSRFDLTVVMAEEGGEIVGAVEYATELYEEVRVRRLVGHLERLLAGMVAGGEEQRVQEISLLSAGEAAQVVVEWNATAAPFAAELSVEQQVEAQAECTPDAVALVAEQGQVSYGKMAQRVACLGQYLRRLGVGPERAVGGYLERSPAMVMALLGVLKAGGVYVPMEPSLPSQRLQYMVADAGLDLVLTQAGTEGRLGDGVHEVRLEEVWQAAEPDAWPLNSAATADNLAYVMYTSGTTGKPKGVAVKRSGLSNFIQALQQQPGMAASEVWLAVTSPSFDISMLEVLLPLVSGGRMELTSREEVSDGERLKLRLEASQATHMQATPAGWRLLMEAGWGGGPLKVLCGGEALGVGLAAALTARSDEVWNLYGPTETTVWSSKWRVREAAGGVRIGRPLANTEIYILDEQGEVMPIGVAGELYIGGAGLARGYVNKSEETAVRFVPNAKGETAGGRLYRTGDQARYIGNGEIEYLGRRDEQVKVRGYRIELGEIEAALQEYEGVQECAVRVWEEGEEKRLVGYVVWARDELPRTEELPSYLRGRLPEYMVPSAYVSLSELPLTANGKLDRKALPAPGVTESQSEMARTPIEEIVAGIWKQVLRVEGLGIHDDFFALGGHSLLAAQVISRIREVLGVEVGVRRLFEEPTVAGLAAAVEDARRAGGRVPAPPIVAVARAGGLPLSYAQQRLWFIQQMEPESAAYNIPLALRLRGPLEVSALEQSLAEIVRRHGVLRTRFGNREGQPQQVIATAGEIDLQRIDLSSLAAEAGQQQGWRLVAQQAQRPFDLEQGPVWRAALIRLAQGDYMLLICLHHIASDGWSLEVLVREVATLYEAYHRGGESPLAELEIQYADYAVWQREWLQGEVLERQLAYWREQLAGAPAVLELPTDRPRPAVQSHRGERHDLWIDEETTAGLKQLSRSQGVTLYMTLLAAYAVLLMRYSHQRDIVIGSPVANRHHKEIEPLIGFFINMLVLRIDLSGELSFRELLRRVREVTLGAYTHQDLSFEKLVEELQPQRHLSHSPLVQVTLTMQNAPAAALELSDLTVQGAALDSGTIDYDLSLIIAEAGGGLKGVLRYNADLLTAATVRRLTAHLQRLLAASLRHPECDIADLPLLSEGEQQQVLSRWQGLRLAGRLATSLPQGFARQVTCRADAVAVEQAAARLSYGELDRRANQLAHYLRRVGVGPEVLVGLCMEPSPELIVAMLGILKAGGAYLPLSPDDPLERLAFMIEDAGLVVIVSRQAEAQQLPSAAVQVIELDSQRTDIEQQSDGELESLAAAEQLAYVMYTSGSTGEPKGVGIVQRGVLRLVEEAAYVRLDEQQVVLQGAAVTFDASTFEIWGALLGGGRLVIAEQRVATAESLQRAIQEQGVTTMWLTASLFNTVVEEEVEALRGLQQLLIGGEALSVKHVRQVRAALPEVRLINGYGPTEATTFTCTQEIGEVGQEARSIAIGRAISDTRVYVLDERQEVVPEGVIGELYIGGGGVGRGYWGRAAATAERFVPDGKSAVGGERLYRSGDLVRYGEGRELEYVGRRDHQVKVRGYRIELEEIEETLKRDGGVREAGVVVKEEGKGKRLVAYVEMEEDRGLEAVKARVRERLPEYMAPSRYVRVEQMPLTASGKLDRAKLAQMAEPQPAAESKAVNNQARKRPVEELVEGIWCDVLGLGAIGMEENFFELGGHSLLATQVVTRVRKALGVKLELRALFERPTLREMSEEVEGLLREGGEGEWQWRERIERRERRGKLPLSFAQQRLWFIQQLEPHSAAYTLPSAVRLPITVDVAALRQSLSEITRRHEMLRTRFEIRHGQPVQVIDDAAEINLLVLDLTDLSDEQKEKQAADFARADARRTFDLERGPVWRAALLRLTPPDHILLLNFHHIVSDGWSGGLLVDELIALYEHYRQGEPSSLPELPVQYADFALWQREWLQGTVLEDEINYWRGQLSGVRVLDLPTDHQRPPVASYRGAALPLRLSPDIISGIYALCRREEVTPFMCLLAALNVLLFKYSGQEDISVGSPIANRNRKEIEGLIGNFANTLVMRSNLTGNPSFVEFLRRVREVTLDAYLHQDLPFEKIVEELQPERDLSHNPLFQVLMGLHNLPERRAGLPGLGINRMELERVAARFDLSLDLHETTEGLRGGIEYSTDLFERSTVERLAGHFANLLAAVIAEPAGLIGCLPLMAQSEAAQLTAAWSGPQPDCWPGQDQTLHELIEAQARSRPDAIAASHETEQVSYGAMNRRANRLAHVLRELGVGPETVVGVYLDRSLEKLLVTLSVMKAGGAYLPIATATPPDRVLFTLADARAALVVTRQRLAQNLAGAPAQVLTLESAIPASAGYSDADPAVYVLPSNLAYVIYTSGSTGKPKGVGISHRSVVHLIATADPSFGFCAGDVWSCVHSFSFDFSVWEIWTPLVCGSRLLIVPRAVAQSPDTFLGLIRQEQVTVLHATPAALRALVELRQKPDHQRHASTVRLVASGGEALPRELAEQLLEWGVPMWNFYGPTETTVWATAQCVAAEKSREEVVGIGRGLANTHLRMLDRYLEPVCVGVFGELCIGGEGVARGYINRPDLTAEKFIPDPLSQSGGARCYQTGDMVRSLANREIDYLGRRDHQVKIRGYRIELGEIEAVLGTHEGVSQCAVSVQGQGVAKRLVAYVVAAGERAPSEMELYGYLKGKLPDYMVPATFIGLSELPLTASRKLDRRALPEPTGMQAANRSATPRTPLEEILCGIFAEVLLRERVGADENFFEMGGHSLLATQVTSRVREVLGVEMPLRALFERPTVAGLAAAVESERQAARGVEAPPIVPVSRAGELPLSFAQQRLWFIQQLEPESAAYNIPLTMRLAGELNVPALRQSLGEIARRHEVLRTSFQFRQGQPVQVIAAAREVELPVWDLSGLSEADRERQARELIGEAARRPFDLERGPWRAALVRLRAADHALVAVLHHVVSDGWSTGVLVKELASLYGEYKEGRQSRLPQLEVQYGDFAVWQREWLQGERLASEVKYWKGQLRGAPILELLIGRARPAVRRHRGARWPLQLSADLSRDLKRLCQREGVTLFMTMLAAFQTLLQRYTGVNDIVIGTPIANRNRLEVESLIGFFVNMLALRTDLSGEPTFVELLRRVREVTLGSFVHQDLPFDKLVEELQPDRRLEQTPLFRVALVMQNAPQSALDLPGLRLVPFGSPADSTIFDLTLYLWEGEDALSGSFLYDVDLYDPEVMRRLASHFRVLLEGIATRPQARIGDLPVMTDAERHELLHQRVSRAAARRRRR